MPLARLWKVAAVDVSLCAARTVEREVRVSRLNGRCPDFAHGFQRFRLSLRWYNLALQGA